MIELEYYKEVPYVVMWGDFIAARFSVLDNAERYAEQSVGRVIDTTPKPKIPEDAEFIFVKDSDQSVFARREGVIDGEMMWLIPGDYVTEEQLIEDYIGDAEVTVLVRKEAS